MGLMQRRWRRRDAAPSFTLTTVIVGLASCGLLLQIMFFTRSPTSATKLLSPLARTAEMRFNQLYFNNKQKRRVPAHPEPFIFGTGLNYSWSFPVYYINMDKSVARRERMELDFGRLWDLRRSPAVDGSNDTEVLALMGQINYDRVASYVKEDRSPDSINRAELGCVLSHLATIRRAYVEGCAVAMIVEDDITPLLMPFWTSSPQDLLTEAETLNAFEGQPWDIVQLAWIWGLNEELYDNIQECHGRGRQLVRVRFQFGTSAYIISRAGMEKVLDTFFSDRSPPGLIQLWEGGRQAELYVATASNVLVTVPSLFTIDGADTTISTGEEERRRLSSHRESNWIHVQATLDLNRKALKAGWETVVK